MRIRSQSLINDKNKMQSWVIICYGNILRSQVLEQYIRHYTKLRNIQLDLYSAGIADYSEYTNTVQLLEEVRQELQKRIEAGNLCRKPWSDEAEKRIINADIVLAADTQVKAEILRRLGHRINKQKVYTFYEVILGNCETQE